MNSKVILVTDPDDVAYDGVRLLLVNLTANQTQLLSTALSKIGNLPMIVLYIWNNSSPDWLFDKKYKSHHIIFNAEDENELITGYMSAQRNSSYFGILKTLAKVNTKAIYSIDDCIKLLETVIGTYEQQ
jgi:hypothetical protein